MILSTAYFPPVEYFALLARDMTLSADRVIPSSAKIEACESYQKQSWRNRCLIMSASGTEMLQVPIIHGKSRLITDIRIEYSTPWVTRTERTMDSAYHTSAFYDYYRDEIFDILESQEECLFELNIKIINYFLEKTGIAYNIVKTMDFEAETSDDWREKIHPKRQNSILEELGLEKPYFQVFSGKYGFIKGLSIMDLLFNEGPDSILFLKKL
jgi:hypothetical protein